MGTASALQLHKHAVVILDEEAAAKLSMREYYDWVFAHDRKWENYR